MNLTYTYNVNASKLQFRVKISVLVFFMPHNKHYERQPGEERIPLSKSVIERDQGRDSRQEPEAEPVEGCSLLPYSLTCALLTFSYSLDPPCLGMAPTPVGVAFSQQLLIKAAVHQHGHGPF